MDRDFVMREPIVPWKFLELEDECSRVKPKAHEELMVSSSKPPKSFADAVNNVCDIPVSKLPKPCVKGDRLSIVIPKEEYLLGVESCKHNLHGRIIWPKGSTPLTVQNLKTKLLNLWKSIGKWGITSLGKGYYELSFSTLEDVRRVRSISSWNLNPGFLKLFPWTKDFNPSFLKQSSAQVWILIHGLSQEYWRPKIIFAIASSVGIPLYTDSASNRCCFERSFGHFVRVLVDLDLNSDICYKVLVERSGFAFFVDLEYENLPEFCKHCNSIGHSLENCKHRGDEGESGAQKQKAVEEADNGKSHNSKKHIYVQVPINKPTIIKPVDLSQIHTAVDNSHDKDKQNQVNIGGPTGILEVDNTVDDVVMVDDTDKTLALVSEAENNFADAECIANTQGNSVEEVPETNSELQQDLMFLNASWNNMVHQEMVKQGIGDNGLNSLGVDDDSFVKVKSKSKKRSRKTML
ncbi:unnamed protein product [Lathyrus sativus]|nr:unnamed protein product [Lathyrus sativus]